MKGSERKKGDEYFRVGEERRLLGCERASNDWKEWQLHKRFLFAGERGKGPPEGECGIASIRAREEGGGRSHLVQKKRMTIRKLSETDRGVSAR